MRYTHPTDVGLCLAPNLLRIPGAAQGISTMLVSALLVKPLRIGSDRIGLGVRRRTEIHSSVANLLVVWMHHVASERSFVADHQLKNRANDERKTREMWDPWRWLWLLSGYQLKLTTTSQPSRGAGESIRGSVCRFNWFHLRSCRV